MYVVFLRLGVLSRSVIHISGEYIPVMEDD